MIKLCSYYMKDVVFFARVSSTAVALNTLGAEGLGEKSVRGSNF